MAGPGGHDAAVPTGQYEKVTQSIHEIQRRKHDAVAIYRDGVDALGRL
jgi:hypothetical protein